jgi:hypothetical protein
MSDLPVRDRVTAILTLAEAAKKALDFAKPSDVMFVAQFQHTAASEAPWLARMLLEALDTIDRVNALFAGGPDTSCRTVWDGEIECVSVPIEDLRQALDGGNE